MRKIISIVLCVFLLASIVIPAFALESKDILVSRTIETLENGDYIVREIFEPAVQPRSSKTGYSTATYKNANGTVVWAVIATGTFSYNGTTSSATSSTANVDLYSNTCTFISKSASYSGNTARATGVVRYSDNTTTLTAHISCDKNGNLY